MELPKLTTGDFKKEFRRVSRTNIAEKMAVKFKESGFQGWADYFFEVYNVNAVYENNADSEDRERLNTEAGLIIANHPGGGIDNAAILKTLNRDTASVKMVVAQQAYKIYGNAVGKDLFIPVPRKHNLAQAKWMIRQILEHIQDRNGVVLFYPSGALGKTTGEFQSGFRTILSGLSDDKMVYCFNFNEEENRKITKGLGRAGLDSEAFDLPVNVNRLRSPLPLRVRERYTQAGEWKVMIDNLPARQTNEALRDHYLELFGK